MDKIDWTYLTALISIAFGWALNELGQWLRTRQGDRKIKKKILYNLLETNFIFNQLDTTKITELITERVILRIPKGEQTKELKEYLNQLFSRMINNSNQNNVSKNLENIEERYTSAVDNLATIDPVTAYRLNGKTKILETFNLLEVYYDNMRLEFPNDTNEMENTIEIAESTVKPEIINEAIEDLEKEIRSMAFSIGVHTWYKSKLVLKKSKDRLRNEGIEKIDELLDKLIPKQ